MEFHHILAPTDFSEYSQQAIQYARELAQKFGATLVLLHVVELPPYPIEGLPPSQLGGTLLEDMEQQATGDLAQVLAKEAEVKVVRRVVVGIPYRTIVEVAEAEGRPDRHGDPWSHGVQSPVHGKRGRARGAHSVVPRLDDSPDRRTA
jgi:nucleotide-binding universal stress UspA family protein